jgi:hypothetical protein
MGLFNSLKALLLLYRKYVLDMQLVCCILHGDLTKLSHLYKLLVLPCEKLK